MFGIRGPQSVIMIVDYGMLKLYPKAHGGALSVLPACSGIKT